MAKQTVRVALYLLVSFLVVFPAMAQDDAKSRRVGLLFVGGEEDSRKTLDVLCASFADLGYHAGRNLVLDVRYADGYFERGQELASELLRSGAEVLSVGGYKLSAAALEVTHSVPIVGVGCGIEHLGASLAHPGGNITGVTCHWPDLAGKQMQLLLEALSGEKRLALLLNINSPSAPTVAQEFERAAGINNLVAHVIAVRRPEDIETAYAEMQRLGARGAIIMTDS